MSIRTTVTLDDDVIERVRDHSKAKGIPFREALNDLLRLALATQKSMEKKPKFKIKPFNLGYRPGLPYDDIEALIEYGEGPMHR
jgi:hypothetical protein